MKYFTKIILLIMSSTIALGDKFDLKKDFKSGIFTAELLFERPDPKIAKLMTKFRTNISKDQAWFQAYIKKNKGPLPWHEKMGMTKEEYKTMMDEVQKVTLTKVKDMKIKINTQDNMVSFDSMGTWKFLEKLKIKIDTKKNMLIFKHGDLPSAHDVVANDKQVYTGPFNGHCWKIQKINGQVVTKDSKNLSVNQGDKLVKFNICLGKMRDANKGILMYEARDNSDSSPERNSDFAIKWNL